MHCHCVGAEGCPSQLAARDRPADTAGIPLPAEDQWNCCRLTSKEEVGPYPDGS